MPDAQMHKLFWRTSEPLNFGTSKKSGVEVAKVRIFEDFCLGNMTIEARLWKSWEMPK